MGVNIESGKNWYIEDTDSVPYPNKPASGITLAEGSDGSEPVVLLNKVLRDAGIVKSLTLLTDQFATQVTFEGLGEWHDLTLMSRGEVVKNFKVSPDGENYTTYALIGYDAVLKHSSEGNPNYFRIVNQVEFVTGDLSNKELSKQSTAGHDADWADLDKPGTWVRGNG